jgi:hypothetical protein
VDSAGSRVQAGQRALNRLLRRRGFLRVKPKPDEPTFALGDHVYLALPAAPEVKVEQAEDPWSLRVA